MKKITLYLLLGTVIAISSCATFKNVVCPVTTGTICPILESLLGLGASVTITPTNTAHQYIVVAQGITEQICDMTTGICASVDSVLASGKSVTIKAVPYSSNKVNARVGVRYIEYKVKR